MGTHPTPDAGKWGTVPVDDSHIVEAPGIPDADLDALITATIPGGDA